MIPPQLPSTDELAPFLTKLEEHTGSMVIVAITWNRDSQNFATTETGWFSADARVRLKRAIKGEKRREGKP